MKVESTIVYVDNWVIFDCRKVLLHFDVVPVRFIDEGITERSLIRLDNDIGRFGYFPWWRRHFFVFLLDFVATF